MTTNETPRFDRVAAGDYETADGRFRMWRIPDVNPPAWNVIEIDDATSTDTMIVDGAATMRDAVAMFTDRYRQERRP
jgi:hypothetical protein